MQLLNDEAEVLKQAEQDAKWVDNKFNVKFDFEVKSSGNHVQFVEPEPDRDPSSLQEFVDCIYYPGAETSGKELEGSRARHHDQEFKAFLEGKNVNVN
jgi:hypothetical protein